jgi:hypothetical protein
MHWWWLSFAEENHNLLTVSPLIVEEIVDSKAVSISAETSLVTPRRLHYPRWKPFINEGMDAIT